MPRNDGTGPMGRGAMSGKGMGVCAGANAVSFAGQGIGVRTRLGLGLNCRRNFGRNFSTVTTAKTQKELLQEQKEMLESSLSAINKKLDSI